MAYLIIDCFCNASEAEQKADAYRKAGRREVSVLTMDGVTVADCSSFPCEAKFTLDGRPLYVVLAQG